MVKEDFIKILTGIDQVQLNKVIAEKGKKSKGINPVIFLQKK